MAGFVNRVDAGRQLSERLTSLQDSANAVVVGLPRGGVPVAYEVATRLNAPLDVLVVRKIGVPFQPEVAMGAIGEGGVRVVDRGVMAATGVSMEQFERVEGAERVELERRIQRYRGDRAPTPLTGRTVVIVDDGVATGSTARAACQVARIRGAARVVLAVPVGAGDALRALRTDADEVIAVIAAEGSFAVGQWYDEFDQTSDREVEEVLTRAANRFGVELPGGERGPMTVRPSTDGVEGS